MSPHAPRHTGRRRQDRVHWWLARVVAPVLAALAASSYFWRFLAEWLLPVTQGK